MRLIDADEFEEELKRYHMDIAAKATALKALRNLPTAYDLGKVVERLEEEANDFGMLACFREDYDEYYTGQEKAYRHAIEIVKGGGV